MITIWFLTAILTVMVRALIFEHNNTHKTVLKPSVNVGKPLKAIELS